MSTIIIGVIQFFSSLTGCILIDKLGRRILLLFSVITMTITLVALGAFFYIQETDEESVQNLGWLPLTSLCIYIIAYPVGYGGVPWVVVGEIAPKNFKAYSGPVIGFFAWALGFVVTSSFQNTKDFYGNGVTFWIFAGLTAVGIFFTYFVVPETKGKTLDEIENALNNPSNNN
jgi:MFS family permease